MKFSRPALTLMSSVVLAGTVACGQDEGVTDSGDLNQPRTPVETTDPNQTATQTPGAARNNQTGNQTGTQTGNQTGALTGNQTGAQTGNQQAGAGLNQNTNVTQPGAANRDLSAEAIESGVIPEELTGEDHNVSRLAIARMQPTTGNRVTGLVSFIQTEGEEGVRVVANLMNLPDGDHGFHVHENGDCSAPDGSSAGDHFNPANEPHAGPEADARHVGDLGNITAMNGEATVDMTDELLSFEGANSIVGKAIMVHADQDDLMTQPSGASGDPIACGVIEAQNVNVLTRY